MFRFWYSQQGADTFDHRKNTQNVHDLQLVDRTFDQLSVSCTIEVKLNYTGLCPGMLVIKF
jgi:hypothetical protein